MRIVSWNVNGIRAVHRKGEFVNMVEKLQPDIICLQETKAQQGQSDVDLPEYEEFWNSAERKGYSGTAIFTKIKPLGVQNGLPSEIVHKYELVDEYGDLTTEGRVITAEYNDFFLVNVYTPNSKGDLTRLNMRHKNWDPAFLEYCSSLAEHKPVVFCGDMNVAHTEDDLAQPKQNRGNHGFTDEEREGADNIEEAGFVDTFRMFTEGNGHYSWWSPFAKARERNIGWRIDYMWVSEDIVSSVTAAQIHTDVFGSDHCPISIDLDL